MICLYCSIYLFYALLRDSFCERIRMLYNNTDYFFLHFFVDELAKETNARLHFRDASILTR